METTTMGYIVCSRPTYEPECPWFQLDRLMREGVLMPADERSRQIRRIVDLVQSLQRFSCPEQKKSSSTTRGIYGNFPK